jgi:chemotaxis signal transduction protein
MLAVLDLGVRLNLPYATRGSQPKIVVAEHPGGQLAGFIADRVADVVAYRSRDLRNGVLHGLGRSRRLIELNTLAVGDELAQLMIFAR